MTTKTVETGKGKAREWTVHKHKSDILWQAFLNTQAGSREREEAKETYLSESKDFWGEESLGITQLQGRIVKNKKRSRNGTN